MILRLLTIFCTLSIGLSTWSQSCVELFDPISVSATPNTKPKWVPTKGETYLMALRSNVRHMVYWIAEKKSQLRGPLQDLLNIKGTSIVDFHDENVGPELTRKGVKVVVMDLDDGGTRIPLITDFLFHALRVGATKGLGVSYGDQTRAYMKGLNGEAPALPGFLKRMFRKYEEKFEKKYQKYVLKKTKKTKDGSRIFSEKKWDVIRMAPLLTKQRKENSEDQKALSYYRQIEGKYQDLFSKEGYKIIDVGYRVKKTGGSRGKVRFYFLGEKDGKYYLFQAKTTNNSGSELISNQPTHTERISSILEGYGYTSEVKPLFAKVLEINNGEALFFEMKTHYVLDVDSLSGQQRGLWNLYLSQWLGFHVSLQPEGARLKSLLLSKKGESSVFEQIQVLLEEYSSVVKGEMGE